MRRWLGATFAVALVVATLATYANHFGNDFQFDDTHAIVDNAYVRSLRNIPRFFTDGKTLDSLPQNQTYRPFLVTSFAFDYWIGGGYRVAMFHTTTFVLFLLQAVAMYVLYLRIFDAARPSHINRWVALFAVAWYVLHPANAETINYILARSDSLSTFLVVFGLVLFIGSPTARRWHLYLVPVALGVFTKPTAVMFAPLAACYVYLFERERSVRRALRSTWPALLACAALFLFTRLMESETWTPGGSSRFHYVITQPFVLLRYFAILFVPFGLSADTDWQPLESMADGHFAIGMLFLSALTAAAVVTARTRRYRPIALGIVWFLVTLLPTSLVPLAEVTNDHRMFYPFVGLVMAAAWVLALAVERLALRRSAAAMLAGAAVAVLGAYAYATHERNDVWHTSETLWRDVVAKSPRNGRGLMNYGLALMNKGDYPGAKLYFERALVLNPNYSYLYINLGVLAAATGKPREAEPAFQRAVQLDPGNPECYVYYARFLMAEGRIDEAAQLVGRALALASGHGYARALAAEIDAQRGKRGATPESRSAALIDLSVRHYRERRFEESIAAAERALELSPGSDLAYNNICAANNELSRWSQAIAACEKALALNPGNAQARGNLAWARSHAAPMQ